MGGVGMNWPNRLTVARVALVPAIVILLQFDAPVFQVLQHVSAIVLAWISRHDIRYFEFATEARKANIYERALKRHLPKNYAYQRCVNAFYVYLVIE